jgi:hypothetical protein
MKNGACCSNYGYEFVTTNCDCQPSLTGVVVGGVCPSEGGNGKINVFVNNLPANQYSKVEVGYRKSCPSQSGVWTYLTINNPATGNQVSSSSLENGCYDIIVKYTCSSGCIIESYSTTKYISLDCMQRGRGFRNLISTPEGGGLSHLLEGS